MEYNYVYRGYIRENNEDIRNSSKIIFKLEKEDLSAYARQYVNKSDPLYELASKIKPLNDFEDFLIHGQPNLVEYETTNGQWIQLTAEDYAEALKQDEEYHGGNIRLLACKSGMLNDGFAQQLANIMNVKSYSSNSNSLDKSRWRDVYIG